MPPIPFVTDSTAIAALELLSQLEYVSQQCPFCQATAPDHKDLCRLAALLYPAQAKLFAEANNGATITEVLGADAAARAAGQCAFENSGADKNGQWFYCRTHATRLLITPGQSLPTACTA